MRIKSIFLKGFKNENREVYVEFPEDNIVILFGENGCGKTSLLRVLSAVLERAEEKLLEEKVQEIKIQLVDNSEGEKTYSIRKKIVNESVENEQYKYDWGEFPNDISSILFGVDRGISYNNIISVEQIEQFFRSDLGMKYNRMLDHKEIEFAEDLTYYISRGDNRRIARLSPSKKMAQLFRKNVLMDKMDMTTLDFFLQYRYKQANENRILRVNNAFFNALSDIVESGTKKRENLIAEHPNFKEELVQGKDKLLEALEMSNENNLQRKLIRKLKNGNVDEIITECEENDMIFHLLTNMLTELNKEDNTLKAINRLCEVYSQHLCGNKSLKVDQGGGRIVFDGDEENRNNHGLSKLSSGEKQLLTLLIGCMVVGENKDIIMIDEPELSLNIKWKREILSTISEITQHAQIIVATHSSTVAEEHFEQLVKME